MSAWMFGADGIDRAVYAIRLAQGADPTALLAFTDVISADSDVLAYDLITLNATALLQRYDDPLPVNVFDHKYAAPETISAMQACKTLHCFSYQCSEGIVPETAMYKAVDVAINVLDTLVGYNMDRRTPAGKEFARKYDAAIWG